MEIFASQRMKALHICINSSTKINKNISEIMRSPQHKHYLWSGNNWDRLKQAYVFIILCEQLVRVTQPLTERDQRWDVRDDRISANYHRITCYCIPKQTISTMIFVWFFMVWHVQGVFPSEHIQKRTFASIWISLIRVFILLLNTFRNTPFT